MKAPPKMTFFPIKGNFLNQVVPPSCEVNTIIRLGKPTNDGKSRPLVVSFVNYNKKEEIFKKIAGLSKAEEKFKRISNMHEMTKAEGLADKKLRNWKQVVRWETSKFECWDLHGTENS